MSATKPYLACPNCGCTDVQWTAWVWANTNEVVADDGPTDYAYCAGCDDSDIRARDLVEVAELKPMQPVEAAP